jgi:tetratricopeptide (TPR) repeat protein
MMVVATSTVDLDSVGGDMRRQQQIAVCLGVMVLVAGTVARVEAQAARVALTVTDLDGNPVEGVTATITCAARTEYEAVKTSNRKGRVTVTHIDSQQTYTYTLQKEGFQTQVVQVRPDYTETTQVEVVLRPQSLPEAAPGERQAPSGGGRAVTLFIEGAEAQRRGDLDLAEKKFREVAELTPNAAEPHIALAVVAHQRGDFAAAATEAEAALAISPDNEQALLLRYDAYRMQGDADKAAEAAEALRATGDIAVAAGTVFSDGMEAYRAGNTAAAVEKFRQAIDLDPDMVNGYLMLGNIAVREGDPAQGEAMAAKALEVDPGNVNALKVRYDAARKLGDPAGVQRALAELVEADPEWAGTDLFNHAVELYNADDMAGAAAALEKVVELRPNDAKALFLLGMARYNLGETEDARAHLTRFVELAPDDPDAALAREMLSYDSQ